MVVEFGGDLGNDEMDVSGQWVMGKIALWNLVVNIKTWNCIFIQSSTFQPPRSKYVFF